MNNIKKVILSTLVATTAITNIATSATAQGYYPNNPTSNQSNYPTSPNSNQPNYPPNPSSSSEGYNPSQQPTPNPSVAFNPVGQWRCQEEYQDQNSTIYLESVLAINPNQQFEMQGSGTVQMANGMTSQIRSQGQGNWNTNSSKVLFTGQLYNSINNETFQAPIQAEYSATNQGTLTTQVNAQGASNAAVCQRI